MKNSQKGFVNVVIAIIVVAVIAGYIAWDNNLIPENIVFKIGNKQATESNTPLTSSDSNSTLTKNNLTDIPKTVTNNTVPTSAPVVKKTTPATKIATIICQGGIPCPNPGSIKVTLSNSAAWNVGDTYRVSWSNNLPASSYSYYYVQIGTGTSTQHVTGNPGSYGIWKVDKSAKYFDIDFGKWLVDETLANSGATTLDQVKDVFFIRVTAYDDKETSFWQDDQPVAAADSSLFSLQGFQNPTIPDQAVEQQILRNNSNILSLLYNFRASASSVYEKNMSLVSLCQNGLINTSADEKLVPIVNGIISAQGAVNQSDAGIICAATKDRYAIQVTFKKIAISRDISSYCVDVTGNAGDNHQYMIDTTSAECKSVLPTIK